MNIAQSIIDAISESVDLIGGWTITVHPVTNNYNRKATINLSNSHYVALRNIREVPFRLEFHVDRLGNVEFKKIVIKNCDVGNMCGRDKAVQSIIKSLNLTNFNKQEK